MSLRSPCIKIEVKQEWEGEGWRDEPKIDQGQLRTIREHEEEESQPLFDGWATCLPLNSDRFPPRPHKKAKKKKKKKKQSLITLRDFYHTDEVCSNLVEDQEEQNNSLLPCDSSVALIATRNTMTKSHHLPPSIASINSKQPLRSSAYPPPCRSTGLPAYDDKQELEVEDEANKEEDDDEGEISEHHQPRRLDNAVIGQKRTAYRTSPLPRPEWSPEIWSPEILAYCKPRPKVNNPTPHSHRRRTDITSDCDRAFSRYYDRNDGGKFGLSNVERSDPTLGGKQHFVHHPPQPSSQKRSRKTQSHDNDDRDTIEYITIESVTTIVTRKERIMHGSPSPLGFTEISKYTSGHPPFNRSSNLPGYGDHEAEEVNVKRIRTIEQLRPVVIRKKRIANAPTSAGNSGLSQEIWTPEVLAYCRSSSEPSCDPMRGPTPAPQTPTRSSAIMRRSLYHTVSTHDHEVEETFGPKCSYRLNPLSVTADKSKTIRYPRATLSPGSMKERLQRFPYNPFYHPSSKHISSSTPRPRHH